MKQDLKPLKTGENVVMRHENKRKHGTVERRHETQRSYVVQTSDGRKYRRNRKHIRPTKSVPKRREELITPALRYNYTRSDQHKSTSDSDRRQNNGSTVTPTFIQPAEHTGQDIAGNIAQKSPYKTRFGRVVKPPIRYSETEISKIVFKDSKLMLFYIH